MEDRRVTSLPIQRLTEFEGIFREHHGAIFGFLRRFLAYDEDVEDCVQETFLRFWESWTQYRELGQVKAYLLKIARNLAIDHHRLHQPARERTTPLDESENELEERGQSARSLERHELVELVRNKVRQLPLPQRETFILFRYHGMSYQEIAEIQGVSVKTVGSRLYRAMKRLGQQLNGHSVLEQEGAK